MNPLLVVKNVTKYFNKPDGSKHVILDNLNFSISEKNNITSILAPLGGGKSTLLKIIAGLDNDFKGEIILNFKKNNYKLPFIPQKPASFPWLDVISNIKLINSILGKKEQLSKNNLQEIIDLSGLTNYERHYPCNTSYGFRFRITLARTLVVSPSIILLDDPFKFMELETKYEIFDLIKKIVSVKNIKFLFASSDISEVAILADNILLFNGSPCFLFSEIKNENNIKNLVDIKAEIHQELLKENADNFLFN